MKKKRQADKAGEVRIVEIERLLEIKKEKAQVEQNRQQKLEKKKKEEKKKQEEEQKRQGKRKEAEHVVPREARLIKQTAGATMVSVQQVSQPTIKARTSIEAVTSSI